MSNTAGPSTLDIFNEVVRYRQLPDRESYSSHVIEVMKECETRAKSYGKSVNAVGNMSGKWFEMCCERIFRHELKAGITMHVNDSHTHTISEIAGFDNVTWIPYPDAIIRDESNFKAAISVKWGMRHDRMYEVPYSAFAINDVLGRRRRKKVNFYLLTNDDSPSRLATMLEIPVLSGVYHLNPEYVTASDSRLENVLRRLKGLPDLLDQLRLLVD